ncbi:MAG: SH3 beta-barrel fold-containing protein [Bacteroidales bacterium]|nr:SH3 beta-barrel fold-containing protein [Bacteroidales bacterium]
MRNIATTNVTRANRVSIFTLAWQFVKRNGYTLSEALKCAWANFKLKRAMAARIVKFWFTKVDGSIREAYGTLSERMLPPTQGTGRRPNDTVQVYFDTEKNEYRCFKRANLLRFV